MANKVNGFQVGGDTYGIIPDLTFDNYPTIGSSNPVTSNGIAEAIQGATIGTDISVGRTPGSPIGYCSIAYGTNIVASSDYSIVFGKDNKCISDSSIVSGIGCLLYFGYGNLIEGNACSAAGCGNIVSGVQSSIGSSLVDVTAETTDMYIPDIYVGYLNLNTKKLYYDPEMTSENVISFRPTYNYGITYIIDLTNDTGRVPGSIYEYERKRSGNIDVINLAPVLDRYVFLTDMCRNSLYFYKGASYYDNAHDKNYRQYTNSEAPNPGGTFSDEILDAKVGYVYFDLMSNEFLLYCSNVGEYPYSADHPNWLKIKAYKCNIDPHINSSAYSNRYGLSRYRYGRFAYVYTDRDTDSTKYGKVYSTSDYSESTEITNQLMDGEYVIDMSAHATTSDYKAYKYRFTSSHALAYVCSSGALNRDDCGWGFNYYNSSNVSGNGNSVYGGTGCFGATISGDGNQVSCGGSAVAVFGRGNRAYVGRTDTGNAGQELNFIISGLNNTITSRSTHCHSGYMFGEGNDIRIGGVSDHFFVEGWDNYIRGEGMGTGAYVSGNGNQVDTVSNSHITGRSNNVYFEGESIVDGSFNTVGAFENRTFNEQTSAYSVTPYTIVNIYLNKSGIYEGPGVSYDTTNQVYTFDTDKVYKIYGIPDDLSTYEDQTADVLLGIKISNDGHTLSNFVPSGLTQFNSIFVDGNYNEYIRRLDTIGSGMSDSSNFIIGNHNKMYAFANDSIHLIGKGLLYYKSGPSNDGTGEASPGAVYVGAYNALDSYYDGGYGSNSCTNQAQFVVGIGTSFSDRKNGFVVSNQGMAALPSAPDTISEATNRCRWNTQKMLITYGMLQDYAPKTPGAVGKPAFAILTLAANNWSGTDQTVYGVMGMTAGAVVIAQANGSPYAYNQHSIYLSAQADDKLTFTCATLPSVDISVKVVYWT